MNDRDKAAPDSRTGTPTKQGTERGPAAGDASMTPDDVAPRRGRATGILILAAVIIVIVVAAGVFFASSAPDLSRAIPDTTESGGSGVGSGVGGRVAVAVI